jgi:hypothetical protein
VRLRRVQLILGVCRRGDTIERFDGTLTVVPRGTLPGRDSSATTASSSTPTTDISRGRK